MPKPQTSVRVSDQARDALTRIAAAWSTGRDPAVRRLLASYIERQRDLPEDRRLTHISTVLHYPSSTDLPGNPPPNGRLAIRITREMQEGAVSLAYRVPGHARRQAHRDYAARPLADALVTAIALEEPYVDRGLEGLPPLLEQRQANGLWRLVVPATLTGGERRARSGGSEQLQYLLTEGQVFWHSPWRAQIALHLARHLFTGPEAVANLEWLGQQREAFDSWVENLEDRRVVFGGHEFTEGAPPAQESAEGRAATMVWRAERSIALDAVADWLTSSSRPTFVVEPPGWILRMPRGWHSVRFPGTAVLPAAERDHLARGRVLRIDYRGRSALWPVTSAGDP